MYLFGFSLVLVYCDLVLNCGLSLCNFNYYIFSILQKHLICRVRVRGCCCTKCNHANCKYNCTKYTTNNRCNKSCCCHALFLRRKHRLITWIQYQWYNGARKTDYSPSDAAKTNRNNTKHQNRNSDTIFIRIWHRTRIRLILLAIIIHLFVHFFLLINCDVPKQLS